MGTDRRVVCWFSCGVTSAVATKLALDLFAGHEIRIVYTDTRSEHPDNARFMRDCERWFGQSVEVIGSDKYEDVWDVWEKTGWLVGPGGARCTTELKKNVRRKFEQPEDIQVFGFDSAEESRVAKFRENNPEVDLRTPLIDAKYSKPHCLDLVRAAGIRTPEMYALGFPNANCPMCPKGGQAYWNLVRTTFPENFERMSKLERKLDVAICKSYAGDGMRKRVFLDELDPKAGRMEDEPALECGLFCGENEGTE